MKTLKWAVLGSCGIAKRRTIPEGIIAANNAELVSLYDISTEANVTLGKELGVSAAASQDELLCGPTEAVYIATPAYMHFEQVKACAAAGKHVLCEKPLGLTVGEAEEMAQVCEQAGVQLTTAFMMRYHSQHQAALQMIEQGKLGKLVYARAQLSCWYPPIEESWRQNLAQGGGGSLMDMGGHLIDLLEMYLGKIKSVSCVISNSVHDYESEDSAVAVLIFESGVIATVDTFFCIPDDASKNVLELYGSGGSILASGTIGQGSAGRMVAFIQDQGAGYEAQQSRDAGEGLSISPEPVNTYCSEVEEFSRAVLEGPPYRLNAKSGLRSQRILTACYESARTGRQVSFDL